MSTGTVAAVDLGATSGRVILGHVGADTLETTHVARFANEPVATSDGLHWNLLGLYAAATAGLREAFRAEPGIRSVGVDSWAVDYALLRGGRVLGEPFHYRDARTSAGVARTHERMTHAELFARNGLQFLPFTTLYQLAAEPAELLELADHLLLIPDLIGFWLTGVARTELTNASTTGMLRAGGREWDDEIVSALGLNRDVLTPLIAPGDPLGALRAEIAESLGAPAGTPVVAVGSHDTASAVAAVPMRAGAAAYISCGTWGLVGVEVEHPVLTPEAQAANVTNEGGVDGRTRLLHNVMGLWILSETLRGWERESSPAPDLSSLLSEAAAVPATSVPVFDVNDARFLPPGDMVGRIDLWCAEHDLARPRGRAAYVRAIVESLAQAFADAVRLTARVGRVDVRTIHIVGGGALNELLCQRTADRAGLPVVAGPVEATALGNVLVQGRAAGLVTGSLESLRDLVARTQRLRRHEPASR
ncbi:rhamnulokinase family protein [Microbacterium sp. SORGH_AS_0888]|uniref:rhamnulokinase n=1 Tax=Microbacterium sp. SORGH_AS_0888 TaxID=3041791 RepID=UPI00277D2BF9|nr:rhamnulokinase family protein [Microbacterium sp. SORGH_AS_0888]MDQ1129465.1 rhamnulokinase [Microbacterium sp. SORGH_AS_0888]